MRSIVSLILPSINLYIQILFVITLSLLFFFFRIPSLFLTGLHTYVHPDDVNPNRNEAIRAAIRRPSAIDSDQTKPRKKPKEKIEFDESKAQVFRLTLGDNLLQSRVYFSEFYGAFNFSLISAFSLFLHKFLNVDEDSGVVKNGTVIPFFLGFLTACRCMFLIVKVFMDFSASKKIERQLSFVFGVLGFFISITLVFDKIPQRVLDFSFEPFDGLVKLLLASLMGCIVGFLYIPSLRNARCFWIGTDQLHCNLSIISCPLFSRILLYTCYIMSVFISFLWITPFSDRKNASLIAKAIAISSSSFSSLRIKCFTIYGILQFVALRSNVQVFLNESVLCWYQRLHGSIVPDLAYSRAKVFLHNHYLCLVSIQFLVQAAFVLVIVGLSQLDYKDGKFDLVKGIMLFLGWWIVFVWAVMNSMILVLFRLGYLYVS